MDVVEARPEKFLGATKTQFLIGMVTLLVCFFAIQAFILYKTAHLADQTHQLAVANQKSITQGATAHKALCAFDDDLASRVQDSRDFLKLTLAQRIAKYGSVGDVPDSVIKANLRNQQATLASLKSLRC